MYLIISQGVTVTYCIIIQTKYQSAWDSSGPVYYNPITVQSAWIPPVALITVPTHIILPVGMSHTVALCKTNPDNPIP